MDDANTPKTVEDNAQAIRESRHAIIETYIDTTSKNISPEEKGTEGFILWRTAVELAFTENRLPPDITQYHAAYQGKSVRDILNADIE